VNAGQQGHRRPAAHRRHDQEQRIVLIVNTVDEKRTAINDSRSIRTSALAARVTMYTTIWGAEAAAAGIKNRGEIGRLSDSELHADNCVD
jgi:carbamoyl-phosphate synthase large subunit